MQSIYVLIIAVSRLLATFYVLIFFFLLLFSTTYFLNKLNGNTVILISVGI